MSERKHATNNIITYVQTNKSSFDESGFNNADGLVMTQVANMHLENSGIDIYTGGTKTFLEIYSEMLDSVNKPEAHSSYTTMSSDDKQLLEELARSPRYKDMKISNFVENPALNEVSGFSLIGEGSEIEQFAAVTITYEQNGDIVNYMSFRATDGSVDGWTENVFMLSSEQTQAHSDSKAYMNIVGKTLHGDIVGGGHSKGGNDFEYGYLFCDEEIRSRIIAGYIYDSPGLYRDIINNNPNYKSFLKVIDGHFLCPQDSIIGQLLHENKNATFIYSVESGLFEHDPYSWELEPGTGEFQASEQTELSKYINNLLDNAVNKMSLSEREALYSFVYYIMQNYGDSDENGEPIDGGLDKLIDLFANGWKDASGNFNFGKIRDIWNVFYSDYQNMTEEERKHFIDSLGCLLSALIVTTYDYAKEKIELWIEESKALLKAAIAKAVDDMKQWISRGRDAFANIMKLTFEYFVQYINGLTEWYNRTFNSGYRYASSHTFIRVNTLLLNDYANRLEQVNRRISALDRRMDSLYSKVGLQDIWNLLQADLLTGYSWRISQCVNYLRDTAYEFELAEHSISSQF